MNDAVLDASAILALLQQEPGGEQLTDEVLDRSVVSTVNVIEVRSKLVKKGIPANQAWNNVLSVVNAVEALTLEQARIAGDLILQTEKYGLSLGDRSCLALAIALKAEVYTTEKVWKSLKIDVPIHVIR